LASRGITCDWRQHCNQAVLDELTTEYSLIIINTLMLSDDGLQVCALLRSSEKLRYTPILLIVDDSDAESLNMGLKLGANDYLVTPIERNELMARCTSQIKKKHYQNMLRRSYVDSLQQSILDDVTPLYNRRYFDAYLTQLLYSNTPMTFALLLLDLDQFKPINDSFGHQAGNIVLREMANRIIRVIRSSDLCARYGGDEFAAVILNVSAEQALSIAERIRQEIAEMPFDLGNASAAPMCTISIGLHMVATPCDMTILQLLEETDKNLYKAKNLGRNRVCT
jgi:two-component system cell cycle response regulator